MAYPSAPAFPSEYQQFEAEYTEEPPPDYGSALAPSRPPPFNPNAPRTNSLRNALLGIEEFFLSQEVIPEYQRTGTLRARNDMNNYSPIVEEDVIPVTRTRGRERARRHAREFANTLTLRGTRHHHQQNRQNEREPTRQEVMDSLPTFWPICTILITLVQVALFVAVCIWFGLAPISFTNIVERSDPLPTFAGPSDTVTKEVPPNFFIGPNVAALVHVGAQYTPCMRDNVEFRVQAAIKRNEELNLRCCHVDACGYNTCGMITLNSCIQGVCNRKVLGGASVCRNESVYPDICGNVTLHPCCIGTLGDCVITTQENCTFQNGYYHPDKAVCSDVGEGCFEDVCSFTWSTGLNNAQGLRFIFAIFLHKGVVDLLILMLAQLYISWTIEKRIGWLRLFLIYIISGVGGLLLSGIFIPDTVSVGASGSLMGILGVHLVELLQGWKWVDKPCIQLTKLLIFYVVLLVLGTLPYIDNFANIGGFIFGILLAFIFVPYISVGKWDRVKKLCLILTALPIVGFMFLTGFVFFYNLPNLNFCSWCSYINCIPYTPTFCEDFLGNIQKIIPTIPT